MMRAPAAPLAVLGVLAAGIWSCDRDPPPDIAAMGVDSAFVKVVVPILEKQCKDCHFSGGPMYKKMPFDDIDVVAEQGDLLLFQLKGSGREHVKTWLDQLRRNRARGAPAGTSGQP